MRDIWGRGYFKPLRLARGEAILSRMLTTLFTQPLFFILWLLAVLIALSVHEFSHALVGTLLGDETAKRMGRLTLNPAAHVDPLGLVTLVLVGFGWGKPVPYNPYNLRYQRFGPVFVALAGPGMNLLFGILMALGLRFLGPSLGQDNLLIQFLFLSAYLHFGLLLFNLIPVPPLDGSKLLLAALSGPKWQVARTTLETKGPIILLILVVASSFLSLNLLGWLSQIVQFLITLIAGVGV